MLKSFQHGNILVSPLNGAYVDNDYLILSWERVNRLKAAQATSLGIYDSDVGIEWCVDPNGYIQIFTRCPVQDKKAVTHWIFDYVLNDSNRKYLPPEKLKFHELATQGRFKELFGHLRDLLDEHKNG